VLLALAVMVDSGALQAGFGTHPDHPGLLLVNSTKLRDLWEQLTKDKMPPRLMSLSTALNTLSVWPKPKHLTVSRYRSLYYGVPIDLIATTAGHCGVGEPDDIRRKIIAAAPKTAPSTNQAEMV
jgi:hypothetical protein